MEKRPGKANPAAALRRTGCRQFAHRRVIPPGQRHDKVMNGRLFAGGNDLGIGGIQLGNAQIIPNAVMEQVGFLGHEAFHVTQIDRVDGGYFPTGDGNAGPSAPPKSA